MTPAGLRCVAPSRVGVGESFELKIRILGPVIEIPCRGQYAVRKPGLGGPFNLNVERQIQYHDNCLPAWSGRLNVEPMPALDGDRELRFDGEAQGAFPGDTRPIKVFSGFRFTAPGLYFIRMTDPVSGVEGSSNPICVTAERPAERIYWGDPHWQTFFSDGIRCPEELYAFARHEAFLDFGALSDHAEGLTDRQWDYFQAVTNDANQPGRFVTLQGLEWTNHNPAVGAPGHRNVYYRGDRGPLLRSNDPEFNTLDKLWAALDALEGIEAIAIPHHSANVVMGVDWAQGWNPKYETAVEIYSVWGSSEKHEEDGNPRPIRACKGEMRGRHVIDALQRGYRFGFVGGGDIHDGRPGDAMHSISYRSGNASPWSQGFTAVRIPELTRENVFDALRDRRTYATTQRGIYLDVDGPRETDAGRVSIVAASEDGIRSATLVHNGEDVQVLRPDDDPRIVRGDALREELAPDDFCYVRVVTEMDHMAWSTPCWGSRKA